MSLPRISHQHLRRHIQPALIRLLTGHVYPDFTCFTPATASARPDSSKRDWPLSSLCAANHDRPKMDKAESSYLLRYFRNDLQAKKFPGTVRK